MGIPVERYSKITDKNNREICLLRAFPCAWGKCTFCDYIEDNGHDEAAMISLNKSILDQVTGEFGVLEVINSGSCFELPKQTLDDIENVSITEVYKDGIPFERLNFEQKLNCPEYLLNSVNYAPIKVSNLELPKSDKYSVIGIIDNQIITKKLEYTYTDAQKALANGELLKIAVIERHHATGNMGIGLIKGYGLKNGAVATTVGHDSHNIIVVGDNDSDMLLAVEELKRIKGGYTVISNGKVIESLPLIFGGLMSVLPTDEFISQLDKTISAARNLGVNKNIDPFITLSFMALPVIPEIRITDIGMVEV